MNGRCPSSACCFTHSVFHRPSACCFPPFSISLSVGSFVVPLARLTVRQLVVSPVQYLTVHQLVYCNSLNSSLSVGLFVMPFKLLAVDSTFVVSLTRLIVRRLVYCTRFSKKRQTNSPPKSSTPPPISSTPRFFFSIRAQKNSTLSRICHSTLSRVL